MKFTQPLEVTIKKEFLVNNVQKPKTTKGDLFFELPTLYNLPYAPNQNEFLTYLNLMDSWSFQNFNRLGKFDFTFLPYYHENQLPWETHQRTLFFRSSLSYYIPLQKNRHLYTFFGFTNEQRFTSQTWDLREPIIEYGKIFFTPGIQLQSRSIVLKTLIEMPLYQYDFINKNGTLHPLFQRDNFKTQIQIQIQH
ncbi:MAG: hypothetical protein NZ853_04950 [Leptospiraceae bacterium]|nr:hypothetical protein [Leptospiraceae bacterium]MDW7976705.1 hypothetical protein [Leptospiraceae bacterium]